MVFLFADIFCQPFILKEKTFFSKDSITSFSVQSLQGHNTSIPATAKDLLVIVFLSPECPLCKNYSSKLVKLKSKYLKTADFVGVIPGSFEAEDVANFQKDYMPSWKIFRDTALLLTHYLQGKVTPEVLVIDNKNGRLLYKGAIDDWLVSLGKTRNHISNYYLDVALNNFINHKSSVPFTKPIGCIINDF